MEEAERNGDAKGKNRIRASQKRGVIRKWWHPAFFAFIWISSFSVALLAWRSVCASPRCGNRWFRNGQRKQIIRTHLLSEISSDYIGLVRMTGLEPVRHGHTPLKRACLPVPALSLILRGRIGCIESRDRPFAHAPFKARGIIADYPRLSSTFSGDFLRDRTK